MSDRAAAISGVGMTPFGRHEDASLKDLAGTAIDAALADAGFAPDGIDMAFVANSMASITTGQVSVVGQTILGERGFGSIPVYNVDNACASSSSALSLAVHAICAGAAQTVLVVGVEKLYSRDRAVTYTALNGAADIDFVARCRIDPRRESVFVAAVYPERVSSYAARNGLEPETLARIAVKNRSHAAENPVAQFRTKLTIDEVLASRPIVPPITALMCAPIGDGASAAVITSVAAAKGAAKSPVWLLAASVAMGSAAETGSSVSRLAAKAYKAAGVRPRDVDVAEVHDSIAFNELLAYEDLGFCAAGEGAALVADGATTLGGRLPVNPSGGLESRGHPVAATGLAQVAELVTQLRGEAGVRQVPDARIGLAESAGGFAAGATAAIAITILEAPA